MKKIISKNKFLLTSIMSIFFILILAGSANAATETPEYIFIGDSRTVYMIGGYWNTATFDSKVNYATGRGKGNFTNKKLKSFAIAGAYYPTFFVPSNNTRLNEIKNTLKEANKANKGTKVIVWLGVNDLAYSEEYKDNKKISNTTGTPENKAVEYVNQISKFTKDYPNLDFYYVSVTAVSNIGYYGVITNTKIDQFNSQLQKSITKLDYSNFKYIDINSELRGQITSPNSKVIEAADGLHYTTKTGRQTTNFCETIANTIYEKVNDKMYDFNSDGKEFTVEDIKVLYEWCFDSKNKGLHNSERKITINGKKLSSEATWKIMKRYVANYKKIKNVSSCSYADLYNYYIELMDSKKISTGKYQKVDLENYKLRKNEKVKLFVMEAAKEDFNLDGKELTVEDIKVLYEWCFDSRNKGLQNSKRTITINRTKVSSELTWKIMRQYVAYYKKVKNVSNGSYKDLYNFYLRRVKAEGKTTGSYNIIK